MLRSYRSTEVSAELLRYAELRWTVLLNAVVNICNGLQVFLSWVYGTVKCTHLRKHVALFALQGDGKCLIQLCFPSTITISSFCEIDELPAL